MSFAKNSVFVIVVRIFGIIFGLAGGIILSRVLGPTGRGAYSLIVLIPMLLASPASLGIGNANIYFIGKKEYPLITFISNSIIFAFGMALIATVVFLLFYPLLRESSLKGLNFYQVIIPLITLPFNLLGLYFRNILLGLKKIKLFNICNMVQYSSTLILLVIFLLLLRWGLWGAVLSWVLASIIAGTAAFIMVCKNIRFKFSPSYRLGIDSIRYGIKIQIATILDSLRRRLDFFIISSFVGVTEVGYYSLAVALTERLWTLPANIGYIMFPEISSSSKEAGDKLTAKVARNVFFAVTILAVLLILSSRYIIQFLYGEAFLPAVVPISIMLVGGAFYSLARIIGVQILGQGKPHIFMYVTLVSLVVTVTLDFLLIKKWGMIGAALAATLGYCIITFIYLYLHIRMSKNRLRDVLFIKKEDIEIYSRLYRSFRRQILAIRTKLIQRREKVVPTK